MDHDKVLDQFVNTKNHIHINPSVLMSKEIFLMNSELRLEDDPYAMFELTEDLSSRNEVFHFVHKYAFGAQK